MNDRRAVCADSDRRTLLRVRAFLDFLGLLEALLEAGSTAIVVLNSGDLQGYSRGTVS